MSTTARVLFVDDDPHVLRGLERSLRAHTQGWELQFTPDPAEAVERCQRTLFAVVVVDMRMPGMDGLACLEQIRRVSPHTVRVMLTGNTDGATAVGAVNCGEVFRFLVKPVEQDVLVEALRAAVNHYEVTAAERHVLEQTFTATVKVLLEVLSLVNPAAFTRAQRIAHYVRDLVALVHPMEAWQVEVAGMLSQVGCVTLSEELVAALDAGHRLSEEDRAKVRHHPQAAYDLLEHIPRLDTVADIIACHLAPQDDARVYPSGPPDLRALGAQILRVATEFDRLTRRDLSQADVTTKLRQALWRCDKRLLAAAERLTPLSQSEAGVRIHRLCELRPGVRLAEDLHTQNGLLVVKSGQTITPLLLQRLLGMMQSGQLAATTQVRAESPEETPANVVRSA